MTKLDKLRETGLIGCLNDEILNKEKEKMKINVIHRRIFGNERFYPSDEFTKKFLAIFRVNKQRQTTFTERQLRELKELGFDIIIHPEYSL